MSFEQFCKYMVIYFGLVVLSVPLGLTLGQVVKYIQGW